MSRIQKIFFCVVILVAVVLRFWNLGGVPPSPDWDEASLGYNAYSIIHTGRDEYGTFLPVIFRSFDDYKPAGYAYLAIPFVKTFGLNLISVRLPSVLVGILAVIATFFLVKELISRDKKLGINVGLISALLLAISPWHLQFSRVAFEACTGMALNLFTVLFFLKGLRKPKLLVLAAITAALNIHMYQNEKVFTPLLVISLLVIYWQSLIKIPKKIIVLCFIVGFVVVLPFIVYSVTNKSVFARAAGVSAFADITPFLKENAIKLSYDRQNHDTIGLLLDNRRFEFLKTVVSGYISHWDLNWLFISGDLARHHAPNMGLMYLFELPFLFVGLYLTFFGKYFERQNKLVLLSWFLLVPIPASITSGVPHAVRTLNFLPLFQIFTGVGVLFSIKLLYENKNNILKIMGFVYLFFALLNCVYYLDQYFVQLNYYDSAEWQYGYKDGVAEVNLLQRDYKKIVVSNVPYMDQSYIFFLFYLKYPPAEYQLDSKLASGGFREPHSFGKFEFRPIDWDKENKNSTLFVGRASDFPSSAHVLKTVNFLNGVPAISIVKG